MSLRGKTKLGLLVSAFAIAYAFSPAGPTKTYAIGTDDKEVVLTGCVIRGEDGDGMLLTNVLPASLDMSTRSQSREPRHDEGAGTSGNLRGASNVIYWLDDLEDDDNLPEYAGRRVEVRGELEGDIDTGEMEIERDGDWVKMEIKSDGKKLKARIPYASVAPDQNSAVGTSGTLKDDEEIELKINVRKIDVKDVTIVTGTCS